MHCSSSFFDIMIYLTIHLVRETKLCEPSIEGGYIPN